MFLSIKIYFFTASILCGPQEGILFDLIHSSFHLIVFVDSRNLNRFMKLHINFRGTHTFSENIIFLFAKRKQCQHCKWYQAEVLGIYVSIYRNSHESNYVYWNAFEFWILEMERMGDMHIFYFPKVFSSLVMQSFETVHYNNL